MQYSIGDCLGEYGFQFYEFLNEPIFLISKIGKLVKANKAGRKLMAISQFSVSEMENKLSTRVGACSEIIINKTTLLRTKTKSLHLKASILRHSDYILLEIRR